MGASISKLPALLPVEPGGTATTTVTVRNMGTVVDELTLEVLGDAADWAEIDPPSLSLFPGTDGEAALTFRPPRLPTVQAGPLPVGLKVTCREDPVGTAVVEGMLDVGAFTDTSVEILPRNSHGRLAAKHELALDNRGNVPVSAVLAGIDADERLRFAFRPASLDAPPGGAVFSKVRVAPRKRFFRGPARTARFQVAAQTDAAPPQVAEGSFVQEALLPRWLLPLVALLGALALLWAFALRPSIRSEARSEARKAVQKPLAQQGAQLQALKQKVNGGGSKASSTPAKVKVVVQQPSEGKPFTERLAVSCPPRCGLTLAVPGEQTFSLTDVVLENPAGDSGTLVLEDGQAQVLVERLDNFRDLDYHFIAPLVVPVGDKLSLQVTCDNAKAPAGSGTPKAPCTAGAYLAGFTKKTQTKKTQ